MLKKLNAYLLILSIFLFILSGCVCEGSECNNNLKEGGESSVVEENETESSDYSNPTLDWAIFNTNLMY